MSHWLHGFTGIKACGNCGQQGSYDMRENNAPVGWIHLRCYGVDEYVCSMDCVAQIRKWSEAREKALAENRLTLPPDVVI